VKRSFDIAVIGAGPAGSVAAMVLARAGRSVALIEKERMPRYKTCGGGVVSRALADLPCPAPTERNIPLRRVSRIVLHHAAVEPILLERPHAPITMVMRSDFDAYLARQAEAAGAARLEGAAFRGFSSVEGRYGCLVDGTELHADAVIGADGAESRVARAVPGPPARLGVALEGELPAGPDGWRAPLAQEVRFDFGPPEEGYAWVFPKEGGLSVGVFSRRHRYPGLRQEYRRYVDLLDLARGGVREARLTGHRIPIRPRRSSGRDGILLAGDAAGLADPLTGEGISYAIRSGRLAAEAILAAGDRPRRAAAEYHLRLEFLREEIRAARIVAGLIYRLPSLAFRTLARHPAFPDAIADVFLGQRSYRDLLRRALRAPWRLL
jgi:geranylgeranyl reductase family protein